MATLISCSIIVGKMFDLNFIYIMFLDDYEMIRQHMKRYIETGSTNTPCHGRGQRNSRKNSRFDESEEEAEFENLKVTPIFRFGNRQVFPVNMSMFSACYHVDKMFFTYQYKLTGSTLYNMFILQ
mgnify:CR=1 FL=1